MAVLKNIIPRSIKYIKAYLSFIGKQKDYRVYSANSRQKVIVVNISDTRIYKRYYYTFIKFLTLAGYTVYFPNVDFKHYRFNIYKKKTNLYRFTFDEKFIVYNIPPKKAEVVLTITDNMLSSDYFSPMFLKSNKSSNNIFYVPMAMHPILYKNNIWNKTLDERTPKKKSIFMVGTLEDLAYSRIESTPFQIESRTEIHNYLKQKKLLTKINSLNELEDFISSSQDERCIVLDGTKTPISIEKLRITLNSFCFYLALPGVFMPLSHNIIEALSTGAIPILHKNYANIMKPELQHMHNALIYEDLKNLESMIKLAYKMEDQTLKNMKFNVKSYYESHLTPNAITKKIISKNFEIIYLLTGIPSVEELEKNLNKQT